MNSILIIDDDPDIGILLKRFLSKNNFEVEICHSAKSGLDILKKDEFDLVLCDFRLPDDDGINLLKKIKVIQPKTGVIIITGYSDVRLAVKSIKMGALEYITKPLHPDEILNTLKVALEQNKQKTPVQKPSSEAKFIHGNSPQAKNILQYLELVAPTDMTVIIRGDTGTGKEYIANTIHSKSKRGNKPFLAVDCGALSNELAGSELFGHEKGSFTGAINAKSGSFEAANGGTLFLDEIGNLSYEIQVKLLRVLQERKVSRVGSTKEIDVDVRIIVATNEDLKKAVEEGKFREDLYHRLNEFSLYMPPLRERKEDVLLFADFFLQKAKEELGKEIRGFSDEVLSIFNKYPWYGNLRELRNVIRRAVLLSQSGVITTEVLPHEITYHLHDGFELQAAENNNGSAISDLKSTAEHAEKAAIIQALQQTENNKTKAAKALRIDRKTLYNKLKEYNIEL